MISTAAVQASSVTRPTLSRWVVAGLLTAVIDGTFSSVLSVFFYGSTVAQLFQRVASTPFGPGVLGGGTRAALLGVLIHFGVALGWSAVFIFLVLRMQWVQRVLRSRYGVLEVAALYGPFIWLVMSLAVIPLFTQRSVPIGIRWWVQFFGHIPFVGLPIVGVAAQHFRRRAGTLRRARRGP
jgi:hypothetical protein